MKKINRKILSLPPYLSTSWKNISLLHVKKEASSSILVVTLQNGSTIEIPHLDQTTIQEIFAAHSQSMETMEESPGIKTQKMPESSKSTATLSLGVPFQFGEGMENFSSFLQHNPAQAHLPNLPTEMIEKIRAVTKAMGLNLDQANIPKAEPHCNCMYCQIARAVSEEGPEAAISREEEEEVSDDDLSFRSWDIKKEGENLYVVTNPIDKNEHYQVYLGTPIGCTCGEKNCEHIRVVLSS